MPAISPDRVPPTCSFCVDSKADHYCRLQQADYYICRRCGLIFQHPLPTRDSMVEWADDAYASGAYRDYVEARPMKIRHFEDRMADLGERVTPGRLLDIGCSCGYFMEVAAARGFEVHGVEFTPGAIAAASVAMRPRIFKGVLETMPDNGVFDVVSAFDLIEHVPDPGGFLKRCHGLLRPGGTVVISTPDTGHVLRFLMRSRWPMLQPMQHLFLFSRQAMERALAEAGFEDIHVDTAFKTLSVEYLINQIKPLNPLLSQGLDTVTRVMPASVLRKFRQVNIGEMLAVARRS
jgi:2-polyprenyl-3-methyl-5-hydroxy-6-metoxy-1,4-benzoquinol methylase